MTKNSLWGWFIEDGYLFDWLAAAVGIIINLVVPAHVKTIDRYLSPDDPTLSYPHKSNTISNTALYLLTFLWPGCVFLLVAALRRSFANAHHALLSLVEGFALTTGWKRWMNLVGRYRPNWFAFSARTDHTSDGRLAYPSGHSAYMFFSATILTLFLLGQLKIFSATSQVLFVKFVVALVPLWLATFVACTRLTDYKHDFSDVNAGCFIGISCGILCYFLNFPSLFSSECAAPRLRSRESAFCFDSTLPNCLGATANMPETELGNHQGNGSHLLPDHLESNSRPLVV